MNTTLKKHQNLLLFITKIGIILAAFYFMYKRLHDNIKLDYYVLESNIVNSILTEEKYLFILLGLSILNWVIDIFKWKILVSSIKKITFKDALIQSLTAHTAALITPNRIGEYGVKALFYEKKNRKKIVLLNLIHHILQMLVTTIFGIMGIIYLIQNFKIEIPIIKYHKLVYYIILIIVLILGGKTIINKKIRSFYYNKIIRFLESISKKTLIISFILSILKYFIFVHQFLYLLLLFGVKINYIEFLQVLFAFYLIASILPSIPLFDWVIKGSVAIMVLHFIGINELTATLVTTIMWLLNFAVPAILGSYFVLKFKKQPYLYEKSKI